MKTPPKMGRLAARNKSKKVCAADLARQYGLSLERTGNEFVGTIKELRGVIVRGKTANDCEAKALEAAEAAIESLIEAGMKPPVPERERRAQLNLRLTSDELERVRQATRAHGYRTVSEFGREAILAAAHGL